MYKNLRINHIAAIAENRVIGLNGAMPWNIPEDFKFFKSKTMGHAMIMGRKTWDSIARKLPGRATVVVSSQTDLQLPEGVVLCGSFTDALDWCLKNQDTWGCEVFVVGGGEIYRQTLEAADRLFITEIHRVLDGDTRYPEISMQEFELTQSEPHLEGPVPFTFKTLLRRMPPLYPQPSTEHQQAGF